LKGEKHETLASHLLRHKKGVLFVDIGANYGYYSFLLYRNFDNILAIEPHPKNIAIINTIKQKMGYKKITILPFAVNDKNGGAKLYLSSHSSYHSLFRQEAVPQLDKTLIVKTITLNSLLKKFNKVDLIKLDVEGAEWKVLAGAKNVMYKISTWLIELHDATRKNELEKLMKSRGYKVKWIQMSNRKQFHLYAEYSV